MLRCSARAGTSSAPYRRWYMTSGTWRDVESKVSEDHIYDECRYVLMLNPIEAREPVKPPAVELDDPLDLRKKPEVRFYRI